MLCDDMIYEGFSNSCLCKVKWLAFSGCILNHDFLFFGIKQDIDTSYINNECVKNRNNKPK